MAQQQPIKYWTQIEEVDEKHVQDLGKYAVEEQNKKTTGNLSFERVFKGWVQQLAGNIYKLHIRAYIDGTTEDYEAHVWKKHDHNKVLMSFQEL